MINANALRHPRTQWEIESALWRAIEYGAATACNAAGGEIFTAVHDRSQVPAFSFWRGCEDVTGEFLKVLRAQK
jgi:hypothetical protein